MLKGIFWDLIDKILNQGVGFIISVFLARVLTPEDFGLVGMVLVVVGFSQVLMDMGFSTALIQKQNITEEQYSTIFFLNLLIGCFFTLIIFISADVIARFYGEPAIAPIFRWISLVFMLNSATIVQTTHYLKAINLKPPAIIRGIAVVISGCTGLVMAYNGFGVWSLVAQTILNSVIFTILIWFNSNWRPKLCFNLNSIKSLWDFGYKILIPNILENIYQRLDVLIIGKIFSAASLGFYTRAQSLNNLVIQYSSGSLMKVFFPAISKQQHDVVKTTMVYQKALIVVSFAAFGMLSVLYVNAENIVILLFTDKWLQSVDYFKILILGGYAYPLSSIMVNVISGRGNSAAFLKLDLLKKGILTIVFIIGFQIGIIAFLYGMVIFSFIAVILNMYFISREIGLNILKQIKVIIPYSLIAIFSSAVTLLLDHLLEFSLLAMLILKVSTAGGIYLLVNLLFNTKVVDLLKGVMQYRKSFKIL